jgi:hypothetical protein
MLTAFAITWFFSEIFLSGSATFTSFIFLIILAAILDFGMWTLGDS